MNTFFLINRVNLEIRFFSLIILIVTSDCNAISNLGCIQTYVTASMIYRLQVPNGDTD